ncbi:thioredoxin peroxidase [Candidatus Photodesmus katoptron]|uniref:thioredoxin-dependent peroxiredoxin n=1 Tax=Candidatus Photodesmus katoptron Akat1 TaxID=1236703 RepID=S3EI77_9GAMM|nr:thioredoxin-dependent thiol peroxidase [Candidatus Photodesmus katoptron]EPE37883.1 thioredoxin reductase [Candidatus Photodesmus katoptron Akat1]KEY90398.1 thioredoxin peroxidase [Candidatus Photodesmus katoptron]
MNTLIASMLAPKFSLLNQYGKVVTLSNFLGKKVLCYFYPKAMTSGCTLQAQGMRDSKSELDRYNVVILGISTDSVKRLRKFFDCQNLNFTLLSDENHIVSEQFGVWGQKKFMGKSYYGLHRFSFLLNEVGIIEYVFSKFKTKEHHTIVLNYLKQKR